jgi:hypothetical protein
LIDSGDVASQNASSAFSGCCVCGSGPAASATFAKQTGLGLLINLRTTSGPFCRVCGLSTFRQNTGHTLVAGWWTILGFWLPPLLILNNVFQRRRIARLAEPIGVAARLDPGRPLAGRPAILGVLVPIVFAAAALGIAAAVHRASQPANFVGRCVDDNMIELDLVSCDGPHDAVIAAVVDDPSRCPAEAFESIRFANSQDYQIYCLKHG